MYDKYFFGFLWISNMTRMRLLFSAFPFRVFYLHVKINFLYHNFVYKIYILKKKKSLRSFMIE